MKNLKTMLAVSLVVFGVAGTAMAQKAMNPDGNVRASMLIGTAIFNEKHEKIGTVDEILLPSKGGEVSAVLSVGAYTGTGAKQVKVPLGHVQYVGNAWTMAADQAALISMPSYWQNQRPIGN